MTYATEVWDINKRQRNKLGPTEMGYLRRISGVSRMDRVEHEVIQDRMDLTKATITDEVDSRQLI